MQREDIITKDNWEWALKIDETNIKFVNQYRKQLGIRYSDLMFNEYPYINKSGYGTSNQEVKHHQPIIYTTEEFKSIILNINNEKYGYLIDVFKKLGIK